MKTNQSQQTELFSKSNYRFLIIGILVIALGYLLMTGQEANTNPDGKYDPDYWNESIFSVRRIRIAPTVILIGIGIVVYSIMKNFSKSNKKV